MRHEEIQRYYKGHYYIAGRDAGGVRKLVGNVDIIVIFVNDSQSKWNERAKNKYKAVHKTAMQNLQRTAHRRGVNLQLRNAYMEASVPLNCTRLNRDVWTKSIMNQYKKGDILDFQRNHKLVHHRAEAPILFVFNKSFRSWAHHVDLQTWMHPELAAISSEYNEYTIVHELLHQFGAVDLYYPPEVATLVTNMKYGSIMGTHGTMKIDSLTSYIIGWSNEIDTAAEQILARTTHITKDYMRFAVEQEFKKQS